MQVIGGEEMSADEFAPAAVAVAVEDLGEGGHERGEAARVDVDGVAVAAAVLGQGLDAQGVVPGPDRAAVLAGPHGAGGFVEVTQGLLEADPSVTVKDLPMAARLVVTTMESAIHRVVTHDPPDDPSRLEDELTAMLMRYLTG